MGNVLAYEIPVRALSGENKLVRFEPIVVPAENTDRNDPERGCSGRFSIKRRPAFWTEMPGELGSGICRTDKGSCCANHPHGGCRQQHDGRMPPSGRGLAALAAALEHRDGLSIHGHFNSAAVAVGMLVYLGHVRSGHGGKLTRPNRARKRPCARGRDGQLYRAQEIRMPWHFIQTCRC